MLLYTCHSSAFSIPSSSKLPPFRFPNISTGNHSTSRRTRASKEWAIASLDSIRQWTSTRYLARASSSSGYKSTIPIHPFPLSTCGRFIWCTQSPSTSDSMNSELFCFHHGGMSGHMHAIFHLVHVEHIQLPGTQSQGSFRHSQLSQGGQSFSKCVSLGPVQERTTYIPVGAYRPQLNIQLVHRGHTLRPPVSVGDPSKIRPYSSLTGLLISLFSLTAFSSRKPKNKRKAE